MVEDRSGFAAMADALARHAPEADRAAATVYGALAAALAHERACYAEIRLSEQKSYRPEATRRWEDATELVAELRAVIAGDGRAPDAGPR